MKLKYSISNIKRTKSELIVLRNLPYHYHILQFDVTLLHGISCIKYIQNHAEDASGIEIIQLTSNRIRTASILPYNAASCKHVPFKVCLLISTPACRSNLTRKICMLNTEHFLRDNSFVTYFIFPHINKNNLSQTTNTSYWGN